MCCCESPSRIIFQTKKKQTDLDIALAFVAFGVEVSAPGGRAFGGDRAGRRRNAPRGAVAVRTAVRPASGRHTGHGEHARRIAAVGRGARRQPTVRAGLLTAHASDQLLVFGGVAARRCQNQ